MTTPSGDDEQPTGAPFAIMQVLAVAEPEHLKTAFGVMVDGLVERSDAAIIDWGSTRIESRRFLDTNDGEQYIQITMGVGYIGELNTADLEEDPDA